MEVPLRLTFKNIDPSDAIAFRVRQSVDRLEKFYEGIISCQVVVELPHRHHHKGNLFQVHIDLKIPKEEFIVKQHQKLAASHRDVYVAIHEAFDAAKRALEEYKQIKRGHIKTLTSPYSRGHVVRLLNNAEDFYDGRHDYGFIETDDGREIYFHRNAVLGNHYDQLKEGTEVRFVEELGDCGPQASTVSMTHNQSERKGRKAS